MVKHDEQRGNDFVHQYSEFVDPHKYDDRRFQDIAHKKLGNMYPKSG